jgi:hypothetical protein
MNNDLFGQIDATIVAVAQQQKKKRPIEECLGFDFGSTEATTNRLSSDKKPFLKPEPLNL